MAEGGDGESRRSSRDHDAEPVEKAQQGTRTTEQPTDAYGAFPSDHSRGTVAKRSAVPESGSWIQVQESVVPSTAGEHHHAAAPQYVQVRDCQGVHVGPVIQHHYHQHGIDGERMVTAETEGVPSHEKAGADMTKVKHIREISDEYKKYCRSKIDIFVETRPCKEAREVLVSNNSLLLLGNSGDGKTSALYYLSANPLPGYLPIPCNYPKEIQKYHDMVRGTAIKLMFVVDEPFGGSYTQQKLVDDWLNKGKNLLIYLDTHKFIFASRISVWQDCNVHFYESSLFCNAVDVTHARLTADDKQNMLEIHVGDSEGLPEKDRQAIVNNDKPIAYSQCCKLLGDAIKKGRSGSALITIFERPFSYLSSELKKMAAQQKGEYATLCLVMLAGGQIIIGTKSNLKMKIKAVCEACNYNNLSSGDLRKCLIKLTGIYLEKVDDKGSDEMYKFSHDSIHEAVIMAYGEQHFQHCLNYLHDSIIVKIARPHEYNKGEQEFALNVAEKFYQEIAQIFTKKVNDGNRYLRDVFANPSVQDARFEEVWCEYLKSRWWFERWFFCRGRDRWSGICVLCYSAQFGADILHNFLIERKVECRCSGEFSCRLIEATRGDKIAIVKYLLSHKPNRDQVHRAVLAACQYNTVDVLRVLLSSHTLTRDEVCEAIRKACGSNSVDVMPVLLSSHILTREEVGMAVYQACEYGHAKVLGVLLSSHTLTRDETCMAVEKACEYGSVDVLPMLFAHRPVEDHAEVVRRGLEKAAVYGHVRSADYLITQHCPPACTGPDCPCVRGLYWASVCGHTDIVTLIITSHGQNVNTTVDTRRGSTSLHKAAVYGEIDVAKFLVSNGAEVNARNNYGSTSLHWAAQCDRIDVAKFLVLNGADVNARNNDGDTSLHMAVPCGRIDVVKFLVSNGADVNVRNKYGSTSLHVAAGDGKTHVIKFLVSNGADVNASNKRGKTSLDLVAENSKLWDTSHVVKFLRSNGGQHGNQ